MKQLYTILVISMLLCVACEFKFKQGDDEAQAPLIAVERYDRLEYRYLTTGDFSALQEMHTEYPIETRTLIEDVLRIGDATDPEINTKFLKYYQDTTLQMIIADAEAQYADMSDLDKELNQAFTKLKRWFPGMDMPRIYAQISALDESIVVGNQTIGISIDKYLGEDYPFYKKHYSVQQRQQMTRGMILPDALCFYLMSLYSLKDFETCSQVQRDVHVGKIQWVVNQALGRPVFKTKFVDAVGNYMKQNVKTSYEELLQTTDFSQFSIAG